MLRRKKITIVLSLLLVLFVCISVNAAYINNNRDTLPAPEEMVFEELILDDNEEYNNLYSAGNLEFYYRKKTDVFVIKDKRNGYSWKTGIDSLRKSQLEDLVYETENPEVDLVPAPTMTDTYVDRANSTITIEYYDAAYNLKRISSNNKEVSKSYKKSSNGVFKFTYNFKKIKLTIDVIVTFSNKGINVKIPDSSILEEGEVGLSGIEVFPFLGAIGGEFTPYDFNDEFMGYDNEDLTFKADLIDGYSVIPDGSGALVRFRQNTQEFKTIDLPVYGTNAAVNTYSTSGVSNFKEEKNATMPMFGMAHGYNQNAYLAYADQGDRYMHILSVPYGLSNVFYNWTYAKFFYNLTYFQVYNQAGQGNLQLMKERCHFDVSMNYEFLCGDGSLDDLPANYIGIANAYKKVIAESMKSQKVKSNDIPIRIDFLMSDTQPAIIGLENVVMTTAGDVRNILNDLQDSGITNINSGLLGYMDGGISTQLLHKTKYASEIGSKRDFKNLINDFKEDKIDISFVDNYYLINESMYSFFGKAIKHYNGQYAELLNFDAGNDNLILSGYLRTDIAAEYANKKLKQIIKDVNPDSYTITGITNNIISHHKESVSDSIDDYVDIMSNASNKVDVNAYKPNSYLWPYITRYLNASAFNSQYLAETDSIPLISYILNDFVEVYADYSNFSFFDQESILRLIDYNLLPSFVISQQSSHLLINTNSNSYFSTEYSIYKDTINNVYSGVNNVLKHVYSASWTNRTVLDNGIIKNDYSNGKSIIINYTDDAFTYNGTTVNAMSSLVVS